MLSNRGLPFETWMALLGLAVLVGLVLASGYALVRYPYRQAVYLWQAGEEVWGENPRLAPPAWTNFFRREPWPGTYRLTLEDDAWMRGPEEDRAVLAFSYPYRVFPQDVQVVLQGALERPVLVRLSWERPDGRRVVLEEGLFRERFRYRASQDPDLGSAALEVLMGERAGTARALPGRYALHLEVLHFGRAHRVKARLVVYGRVHGWAGTDHLRRDLSLPLLWGAPVALGFGLLAAVGTTLVGMVLAAVGAWFGGWVDQGIQRLTEMNLVLPVLPVLMMIGVLYSRRLEVMLLAVILLNLFGYPVKTYRAAFLQLKHAAYIEAARAYGASDVRILLLYLLPRMVPTVVPALVTSVPSFVFLEASLAVLGLGDPRLPTWGKVLNEAREYGAFYHGHYYWVLEPVALLLLTGLGFAALGLALERGVNPRLREE